MAQRTPAAPTKTYGDFEDDRIKHLEMLQAVIARLGSNGFLIKGWAVTVAGVFVGLAVNSEDCSLARVGAAAAIVFWGLDGYFLRAERRFRKLFDRVRLFDAAVGPFFMGATASDWTKQLPDEESWELSWFGAMTSWTLLFFYGAVIGSSIGASLLI